jgi:hypothetical protein
VKRVVVATLGLAVLVVAVVFPAWAFDAGSVEEVYEPTTITDYSATFDVAGDGSMRVVETIVVAVSTSDRHGIFRFFDVADPHAPELRRAPRDVSVRQDGLPAEVEELSEDYGRYEVLKIGDPDTTLSFGEHTYEISYTIDDVLIPDDDGEGSRFYWDLVPGGWAQRIDEARLTVELPADTAGVQCAVGVGTRKSCYVSGEGDATLLVGLAELDAYTPVTVSADLARPVPPVQGDTYPWSTTWDPVLAPVPWVVLVALLGLAAAAVGLGVSRRAYEPTPRFPLQYAPPPGIGPAQAAYVLEEGVGREQFVATVLHAAEQCVVTLDREQSGWTVRATGTPWTSVDAVTAGLAGLVGRGGQGFTARSDDVTAGKRLAAEMETFESGTAAWARRERLVVTGPLGGGGGLLVLVAFAAALALALWNPLDFSLLAVVPGLFAVGGSALLLPGASTVRTAAGRDLWSRVGGFRRVLSTPASKERFDFSGREELYTAYVPWAVALGCASAWAAKFRTETGREPPVPAYLGAGYAGDHTGAHVDRMVGDFSATLSSAIGSYEATQRSSSSGGGGGFSGGGGGGGGGGGSW